MSGLAACTSEPFEPNVVPKITLTQDSVAFTAVVGGPIPDARVLGELDSTASKSLAVARVSYVGGPASGWLTAAIVTARVGQSAAQLTLAPTTQGLPAGSYSAMVTLTAQGAVPQTVSVTLVVYPALILATVSVGGGSCGVASNGAAYCWGLDLYGELGLGPTASVPAGTAGRVVGGLTFAAVSAGAWHTCGVTTGGAAYCWGDNQAGELGDGTTSGSQQCPGEPTPCSPTPVVVAGGLSFASISAGTYTTCGVTSSGAAYCWGEGSSGQLGAGTAIVDTATPVAVAGGLTFKSISVGSGLTCGVTSGDAAYCWGSNSQGALGIGSFTSTGNATPVAVSGGLSFSAVSAGAGYACGVTATGAAYCWGANAAGELGNGSAAPSAAPVPVSGGLTFATVSAGQGTTCGVTTGGIAYCWGGNALGNLGNGTVTGPQQSPVAVSGRLTFTAVSVGAGAVTCGIASSGVAYCWGSNEDGLLGDGITSPDQCPPTTPYPCSATPLPVADGSQ
ncbi:MAG TPA: hypothetical protein VN848_12150 [Gemmatimonadales bacterium]|nr:hypothetical protein [Gemmatimonadales bacterium]